MRILLLSVMLLWALTISAQTTVGLVAHYPFDTSYIDVTGNSANVGFPEGNPSFACGVVGNALLIDGVDDRVSFIGQVTGEFTTEDLTISFYFKATGVNGTQYLMSKRSSDCSSDNVFNIRYVPNSKTINAFLGENAGKSVSLTKRADIDHCWQHLVLLRRSNRVRLYLNGTFREEMGTVTRVNIANDGDLILGSSDCLAASEVNFKGLIDDLRIYNRALEDEEIQELYFMPDRILNQDTSIFLGNSVDIRVNNTCSNIFNWDPNDGVVNANQAEPTITPPEPGQVTYYLSLTDSGSGCIASDSISINVIDATKLDCQTIFMPNVFTPNGDGLNDTYGISNPFVLEELISFEIFDRWGGKVFFTDDAFEQWDGQFKGQAVNPGVMLYKVVHRCEGEELVTTGSVTILK